MKQFNFNDHVKVKITAKGEDVWCDYYRNLETHGIEIPTIKRDIDGYTEMCFWEVCSIFGPKMYNGCTPPVEMFFLLYQCGMNLFTYNPPIEERIINFARNEAPFKTIEAARWFRLPVAEVDQVICEMVSARQLRRVWVSISGDFWNDEEVFDLWN